MNVECWNCKKCISSEQIQEHDGNCPLCRAEFDWQTYCEKLKSEYELADHALIECQQAFDELKSEATVIPNEQGTNEYGLDVAYFRNAINRELNRDLSRFKPDEIARVLARLSVTADKEVMREDEFSGSFKLEKQAEGVKPELPPRPPKGEGLPRYGVSWNGEKTPITKPMVDGYWTPFHLVQFELNSLRKDLGLARLAFEQKIVLLDSCESALAKRDEENIRLNVELKTAIDRNEKLSDFINRYHRRQVDSTPMYQWRLESLDLNKDDKKEKGGG